MGSISHGLFSVCVESTRERQRERERFGVSASSAVLWDKDPILINSFNLNYLLKPLSPNTVTLEVRISIYEFLGDKTQFITGSKKD